MVKAYLLNVINQKDVVLNKIPCVKRNDLTIVPDILIYDKVESNNICTFQNKLGITLSYTLMGEYNCIQDALNVYQNGTADYTKAYDKLTSVKTVKEDFTWNMLILVDPTIEKEEISYNYILLKRIDLQDIETFLFFDACMIFETLKVIKVYIESFGNKSKLTKRENRFLGYYLEIVTSISNSGLSKSSSINLNSTKSSLIDEISALRYKKIQVMVEFVEKIYNIKIPKNLLDKKIKSTKSFGKPHLFSIMQTLGNFNREEYYRIDVHSVPFTTWSVKKMGLSKEEIINSAKSMAKTVKALKGEFIIASHNDNFVDSSLFKGWSSTYEYTIRYVSLLETNDVEKVEKMNL